ncbi:MAG: AfsR/SARP family transcriptional regulator, partial [Actinomycetota bacterium]|nr:AfsR/SARP family transcriptional regulator [Actinomycetota bacterium]
LVFGLYWAAHRYALSQNPDAYQQLVDRYGEPDHTLMHHGRAFVTGDYQGQADWTPKAIEELRRQGDDHLAERAEINVPTAWLNLGRYEECDARLRELLSRYQEQGPPTFTNWTLLLLGYSASFQGKQDQADAYFEEAINIEVPPRTYSPNKTLEARAAFRRGNHLRAFRTLQTHIDELLTTDNMQGGSLVCIEFINMMTQIDRLNEASHMLDYLETTGLLEAPAWHTLIDDSAGIIASSSEDLRPDGTSGEVVLDDRQALEFMSEVLEQLAGSM